ncbi:uroporphyrinogen decarboxylase family protein [Chloroflexota bacterium]
MTMTPRERVRAALEHRPVDRTPRFEIWIDGLLDELGFADAQQAAVALDQDCVMMPSRSLPGSLAWQTGVDEWGCVWQDGVYVSGVVDTDADLERYRVSPTQADLLFDAAHVKAVQAQYPDHCHIYGTHIGPFMAGYMALGFTRFFMRLYDDRVFIERLLADRTAWAIAVFQRAVDLGAAVIVLGDDAGHANGPMIAPDLWRELILPCHKQIVDALPVPVLWHSDGDVLPLLPLAIEAGFVGFHGLEPNFGIDLAAVKREFGRDLVLVGNVDMGLLCGDDRGAVRADVDRCLAQGGTEGYMIATCNSIFAGLDVAAVCEMFRYLDSE